MNPTADTGFKPAEHPTTGLVLLRTPAWEPQRFQDALFVQWGLKIDAPQPQAGSPWLFHLEGSVVVVGFQPHPTPNHLADEEAKNSPDFENAQRVAQEHLAYLVVAVVPETASLIENAKTAVKVLATLSQDANALAVSSASRLFDCGVFQNIAEPMHRMPNYVPVMALICPAVWQETAQSGFAGCTVGLMQFNLLELEFPEGTESPETIRQCLTAAATLQLEKHIYFKDGDTFKYAGRTFKVELSPGIGVEGVNTLKIQEVKKEVPKASAVWDF